MHIVKNGEPVGKIYIKKSEKTALNFIAEKFRALVEKVTGADLKIEYCDVLLATTTGVVFTLGNIEGGSDAFLVDVEKSLAFVVGKTPTAVYYGALDLLEKNLDIIFSRGAKEEQIEFIPSLNFEIKEQSYLEESPFAVRSWNLCGTGTEGEGHRDDGTAEFISLNKGNAISHRFIEGWREFNLFGSALHFGAINNIDDLMDEHPEYFMTAPDGSPMKALGGHDSFMNYYNPDVATVFAERLVNLKNRVNPKDEIIWVMPDSPYFNMVENGVTISEFPFTADDGTTVTPDNLAYRSTVYFNFLNRVMARANELRPNTELIVFAYTYSEVAPEIEIDKRVRVMLAPISTNERYAYTDLSDNSNAHIRDNIKKWSKKTDKLGIYTYWNSFRGTIYSRPILDVVKQNLLWFKSIGVYQVLVEGKVDCSYLENLNPAQNSARKFYDLNQAYIWAINKLMWNPDLDVDELLDKYCKIVYKECAEDIKEYFRLIKKGWDDSDAMVWYTTGGDIYYLQFVLGAGVKDGVLQALKGAEEKAVTPSVKRKVLSIAQTVREQINKYENFVKETATVLYTELPESEILSEKSLDYVNNLNSVWNDATPLTVLRNYDTMEFYPKDAKFSCRMIADKKNIYIGYTIFDDMIEREEFTGGAHRVYRSDGSEVISYTETYIGGNVFNQSVYYGYISGFMGERNPKGQFYLNDGSPKNKPIPDGVRDVKKVHLSNDKTMRYYFHVQVIPISALDAKEDSFTPYGSFVYYTDRFGRAGWMGYGLWSKQNFSQFLINKPQKVKENEYGRD